MAKIIRALKAAKIAVEKTAPKINPKIDIRTVIKITRIYSPQ